MGRTNYFKNVETLEDVRVRLIENLQNCNPRYPSFKTMLGQYEAAYNAHSADHVKADGTPYKAAVSTSAEEFLHIITSIMAMDGVQVDRVGTWFWASGNTKTYKAELKNLGFWWNRNRGVWQWHDPKEGKYRPSKKGSGLVKAIHGVTVVKAADDESAA